MAGMRRLSFVIGALALAAISLGAAAPDDMTMGDPRAKVTVVEYASLSCTHCAAFNDDVFPAFKKKYIDTGKVRYVYREFLTDPAEVAAAAAMTARCAGPKRYFAVVDAFFHGQAEMYRTGDARAALMRAGKAGGLSEKAVEACITSKANQEALQARLQRNAKLDDVHGTPAFFLNGKVLEGGHDMNGLDAALEPLLRR